MNCSLSCFRRLFGILSLGITKRCRGGTFSPTSCISPSTIHHWVFSSDFLVAKEPVLERLLDDPPSVRAKRSCCAAERRHGEPLRSLLARESMIDVTIVNCGVAALKSKIIAGPFGPTSPLIPNSASVHFFYKLGNYKLESQNCKSNGYEAVPEVSSFPLSYRC